MIATLIVGAVAVLIFPLLISKWRWSWFLYVLCLVSNGLGLEFSGAVLRPEHVGLLLSLAVLAGARRETGQTRVRTFSAAVWIPLIIWLLFGVFASIAKSPEVISSIYIVSWTASSLLAMWIMSRNSAPRVELVAIGSYAIALVSVLSVLSWLGGTFAGLTTPLSGYNAGEVIQRVSGLAFEPNLMGAIGSLWIAVMVYWRRSLNRRVNSLVWIIALATILTMTRAAWVALAVIVVFALVRDRSRAVQNIGVVIVSIVVVLGSLASGALNWLTPLTDRATSLFDLESGTGGFRARSWAMAFDDISAQNSLFTGLGVNTFEQRHADLVQAGLADYLSNAWIAQLYDVGLLGLCAVIVGLIFVWWSTRRRGDSIAFFVALAITTALTNSLWFAFGWVFMTLFDFRSRIVPNGGIDQKRPTQQDLVNGRVSAAASNRETTTGPTREPK